MYLQTKKCPPVKNKENQKHGNEMQGNQTELEDFNMFHALVKLYQQENCKRLIVKSADINAVSRYQI